MNRTLLAAIFLAAAEFLSAQGTPLPLGSEVTLGAGWTGPLLLDPGPGGRLRLEVSTMAGDPVEVIVDRSQAGGPWLAQATNRTLRGNAEAYVDLNSQPGDRWRVRPAAVADGNLHLRWKAAAFADLKAALKQGLTVGPEVSLPLRRRTTLPAGTGGPALVAVPGPGAGLWAAWNDANGSTTEVWDLGRGVALAPLAGGSPSDRLQLGFSGTRPQLTRSGPSGDQTWVWTGAAWVADDRRPGAPNLGPWGVVGVDQGADVRVWRRSPLGDEDLGLPRDPRVNRALLAATEDGVYAFLASSRDGYRSLASWRPERGWVALAVPQAEGPPVPGLWAASGGAGSLFLLEGRGPSLTLRQFDGNDWRPALDLRTLVPRGAQTAELVPPSPWSKTGSLVLVTDRVEVYDLP